MRLLATHGAGELLLPASLTASVRRVPNALSSDISVPHPVIEMPYSCMVLLAVCASVILLRMPI